MATQAIPPPPRCGIVPKIGGFVRNYQSPTWQGSLKSPNGRMKAPTGRGKTPTGHQGKSRDQRGAGGEDAKLTPILQLMVIARNLFHKIGVKYPHLPYCNVKFCLPLSYEL
jgi:hypothetical protein